MYSLSVKLQLACDMQRLSVKLQLTCEERSFDKLHLQHRMDRTEWRPVRSVRGWKVRKNHIRFRDVLWWLSVSAVNRHIVWYNLRRDVKLCSVCRL